MNLLSGQCLTLFHTFGAERLALQLVVLGKIIKDFDRDARGDQLSREDLPTWWGQPGEI